jgi:hypothetical protein
MWMARRLASGGGIYDSMFTLQEGRSGLDAVGLTRGYIRRGTRRFGEQLFSWSLANCDGSPLERYVWHWLLVFPFSVAAAFV